MLHAHWIRSTSLLTALTFAAVVPACGTSAASSTSGPQAPLAVAAAEQGPPPHVFTPRSHPPRQRVAPPQPELASLPRLVDHSDACFGRIVEEEPQWRPPPRRSGKKRKSRTKGKSRPPGYVPYGEKKDSKPSKSGRKRKEASSRGRGRSGGSAGGVPGGVEGGVVGGVVGGALGGVASGNTAAPSAPPAEARPMPKPQAKPEPAAPSGADRANEREASPADDMAAGVAVSEEEIGPFVAGDPDDDYHDWGSSIYLSNDDTMSLSSAQRVIFAIDNFLPLPAAHIRPHELLNYFSFDTAQVGETDDFSVDASIEADPDDEGIYSLAMAVRGRPLGIDERRNANLSIVIDRSGSMSAEGRMEYLKRGLLQMTGQLKRGDMVHLVLFDHDVCVPVQNFVVGRDSPEVLADAIRSLQPRGSTNLHDGLRRGYEVADGAYQPTFSNRVVMVTDAIANRGVTDEQLISTVSKFYDKRRIRLSGVGVGRDFNDSLLDRLTEEGKGAYVFLGSDAEVDAVFGPRFVSLIETTALDVHFRLHLPPSLRMNTFYGEESSTVKEDVQAIHYFANTSQLFLSDLMARDNQLRGQDDVMLTIEYENPDTGEDMVEEFAFNLGEISESSRNVRKGRMVMHFVDGLAWMAVRPIPSVWGRSQNSWDDADAWSTCQAGREDLARMAEGLGDDPEVTRIQGLWDQYCMRYSRPRQPHKRPPPSDNWPSAAGR